MMRLYCSYLAVKTRCEGSRSRRTYALLRRRSICRRTRLIDASALAAMRTGSFLIITARETLVDTDAADATLESGCPTGVSLDVFAPDLPVPIPAVKESTALGAAIYAGIGARPYDDGAAQAMQIARFERTLEPQLDAVSAYDGLYHRWSELYRRSLKLSEAAWCGHCAVQPELEPTRGAEVMSQADIPIGLRRWAGKAPCSSRSPAPRSEPCCEARQLVGPSAHMQPQSCRLELDLNAVGGPVHPRIPTRVTGTPNTTDQEE